MVKKVPVTETENQSRTDCVFPVFFFGFVGFGVIFFSFQGKGASPGRSTVCRLCYSRVEAECGAEEKRSQELCLCDTS